MKGISPFVATIIMIAFVISLVGILSTLIMDTTEVKKEEVEEKTETLMDCGTGVIHIESVSSDPELKVTVENLGLNDLSNLKIVAYNGSGSYTYDATPSSISIGSKLTISSEYLFGAITKLRVSTNCPTVYDEYKNSSGKTTTTTSSTTTTTLGCGSHISFDTALSNDITGCTDTILYIDSSDIILDCQNHYLQSSGSYGINNTGFDNVTVKNCEINMSGPASSYGIYYRTGADNGFIENNKVYSKYNSVFIGESYNTTVYKNNLSAYQRTLFIHSNSPDSNSCHNLTDNILIAESETIYFYNAIKNTIIGGSILASSTTDYYLQAVGSSNSFRNTNFTGLREIYFDDITSCFNYNNHSSGGVWLNTSVSDYETAITRELISWTQPLVQWNDSATGLTVYYNMSGLLSSTNYDLYNNSVYFDTLQTDSNGVLPSFSVSLSGEHEIKIQS